VLTLQAHTIRSYAPSGMAAIILANPTASSNMPPTFRYKGGKIGVYKCSTLFRAVEWPDIQEESVRRRSQSVAVCIQASWGESGQDRERGHRRKEYLSITKPGQILYDSFSPRTTSSMEYWSVKLTLSSRRARIRFTLKICSRRWPGVYIDSDLRIAGLEAGGWHWVTVSIWELEILSIDHTGRHIRWYIGRYDGRYDRAEL
jgi:hypothetical protein